MNELVIKGKKYISSKRANEVTGYAKDYVGQLARGGKVPATRIGRAWYVDESAILLHAGVLVESAPAQEPTLGKGSIVLSGSKIKDSRIPTLSHAFLNGKRNLPTTWTQVRYFTEGGTELPRIQKNISHVVFDNQNKEISSIQEKNNLRIRILKEKVNPSSANIQVSNAMREEPQLLNEKNKLKPVVLSQQKISRKPTKKSFYIGYVPSVLMFTALTLAVLSSGVLVASHVSITPRSDLYTANAYFSYESLRDSLVSIPALQVGYASLSSFVNLLISSAHELFAKGIGFLWWLINLV